MFAIASRYNDRSPWVLKLTPYDSAEIAHEVCRTLANYDLTKTQYRVIPLGDADSWEVFK